MSRLQTDKRTHTAPHIRTPPPRLGRRETVFFSFFLSKRKKTYNPREGWEDGTPPSHRDF